MHLAFLTNPIIRTAPANCPPETGGTSAAEGVDSHRYRNRLNYTAQDCAERHRFSLILINQRNTQI